MQTKKRKWILPLALCAVLILFLILLPILSGRKTAEVPASILSCTVQRSEIRTTLAGGGALRAQEAEELTVAQGVEIERFLLSNGDPVAEGQAIAQLDRVTVMSAIAQVQESLAELSKDISELSSGGNSSTLSARTDGRVKAVYAQAGDDVREVILRSGALAVLSLDGRMAVEIRPSAPLLPGDPVIVLTSDGKEYPGRVDSALNGSATVTLTDDGPLPGDTAVVSTEDGMALGSGTLEVHSPWRLLAADGTVSSVHVREGQRIYSGASLMTLKDTGGTALARLSDQHRRYEELLLELLVLYQDGMLRAPCAGVVSGIDKKLATNMAAAGTVKLRLLADGEPPEPAAASRVGLVAAVGDDGALLVKALPDAITLSGLTDPSLLPWIGQLLTAKGEELALSVPEDFAPLSGESPACSVGDICLFTYTESGVLTDKLTLGHYEPEIPVPPAPPSPGTYVIPELPDFSIFSFGGSFALQPEPEDTLFPLDGNIVALVTPVDSMQVTLAVDELDVLRYSKGMSADITVDALPGQQFTGTVTGIAGLGVNSGGSSKFDVTLTLDRSGDMLEGRNASVVIHTGSTGPVLCIPAAALNDSGSQSFVYTAYDPKKDTLTAPAAVVTGASDGETVEILSGLEEGQTVWYAYYESSEN